MTRTACWGMGGRRISVLVRCVDCSGRLPAPRSVQVAGHRSAGSCSRPVQTDGDAVSMTEPGYPKLQGLGRRRRKVDRVCVMKLWSQGPKVPSRAAARHWQSLNFPSLIMGSRTNRSLCLCLFPLRPLALSLSKLPRVPLGPQAGSKGVQSSELPLRRVPYPCSTHTQESTRNCPGVRTWGTSEVRGFLSLAHTSGSSLPWYPAPPSRPPSQPLLGREGPLSLGRSRSPSGATNGCRALRTGLRPHRSDRQGPDVALAAEDRPGRCWECRGGDARDIG